MALDLAWYEHGILSRACGNRPVAGSLRRIDGYFQDTTPVVNVLLATPAPLPLESLPTWVDISAMAVGAAFGAATGRNRRLPLLAVLIAGVISGLVGGMIRDVLLGLEAAAIENWSYIPAVLLAALAGGFLAHRLIQGHLSYQLVRALAVGLLVTVGVQKGIEYQAPADAAIFLGILTGTMGGSTADVMAGERNGLALSDHLMV